MVYRRFIYYKLKLILDLNLHYPIQLCSLTIILYIATNVHLQKRFTIILLFEF